MKEFQKTGNNQDGGGNHPGLCVISYKEDKEAPEYIIKNTAQGIIYPPGGRSSIELAIKSDGYAYQ